MEVVATLAFENHAKFGLDPEDSWGGVVFEVFKLGQRRLVEYHPTAGWMMK